MPTYNYVITSLRRLDLAAMYICNINLFWFFPTSPSPPANRNHRRLSHPSLSKGVQVSYLQIPKRKK